MKRCGCGFDDPSLEGSLLEGSNGAAASGGPVGSLDVAEEADGRTDAAFLPRLLNEELIVSNVSHHHQHQPRRDVG